MAACKVIAVAVVLSSVAADAQAAAEDGTGSSAGSSSEIRAIPAGAYRRTDTLIWVTLGFGVLHHTDHVVRGNHSGFPFTSHVTAFTPTLLVYPLVLGGMALDAGPLYWTIFDASALVGVMAIHATLEPLPDIYDPWADGTNRTGVRSPAMGVVALTILGGLTVGLGASLASSIADGRRYGFTWKRKPPGTALSATNLRFGVTPAGQVTLSFRW